MADDLDSLIDDVLTEAGAENPMVGEASSYDTTAPERQGYAWAEDVFWVYEHLGDRLNKEKARGSGRYALWKWAKSNVDDFVGQVLPKAMMMLEKARDKSSDEDTVQEEEKKAIVEMQRLLRRAVVEAAGAADA